MKDSILSAGVIGDLETIGMMAKHEVAEQRLDLGTDASIQQVDVSQPSGQMLLKPRFFCILLRIHKCRI